MKANAYLVLDTRRAKKDERFPVKLRVSFMRTTKNFRTGCSLTVQEFEAANATRVPKEFREIAQQLLDIKMKAISIINSLPVFSFTLFENQYYDVKVEAMDVFGYFEKYIQELIREDRVKTAIAYRTALRSFKRFNGNKYISFYDITDKYLKSYEKWSVDKGNSLSTVGMHTRALRAIFNYAIAEGAIRKDNCYPFGRRKYLIPTGENVKKALTLPDIKKIIDYVPEPGNIYEERSRDLWLFSYLCNGMNFKDIGLLKWSNIDGDMLRFRRSKTLAATKHTGQVISVYLHERIWAIIKKWGTEDRNPENYIFNIIEEKKGNFERLRSIEQLIQTTNKNMKRIFLKLSINKPHTTYVARHSYSTILKRSGVSIEAISESLGHTSVRTTKYYLDSFDDDQIKEFSKALLNF